ncbi:formate dehydrogenase-O, major subunit, selenocysteine-containing [Klebsiella michiganensis]|nr:formate dehydrogenase-O, major subunit, selenocysteine-containing [Klebsiella michiganensis]
MADLYAPIRAGSDSAFLLGAIRYLIEHDRIQHEYVRHYTNASMIVREDYDFDEGLFSGFDPQKRQYDKVSWNYELDANGYARRDDTWNHPRCVWNLLKQHVERYTPELVNRLCGTSLHDFQRICELLASTSAANRTATILYALGWTHHTTGAQTIRAAAMLQLLLGNIGMAGGGVNALRGHSNIQGYTDLGLLSTNLPGYMPLPSEKQVDYQSYISQITPAALGVNEVNYWQNTPKFFVSMMKSFWGDAATAENSWGYDWLPKWDRLYDVMTQAELMAQGKINGYVVQGFNPLAAFPDKNKSARALAKLKYLVVIDPLVTESSNFWQNHGEMNDVRPADIQTEVFRLPSSCFAEENGSIANSGRWLQWHWAAAEPPGEALHDGKILGRLFMRLRDLYRQEGGANPAPVLNMSWDYHDPLDPQPEEVAREANGKALRDIVDEQGRVVIKKGQQLSSFAQLKDDGSTSSYCWVYCGCWTEQGNQMANRDNSDPYGLGCTPGWAWSWPANRRILYNRASADPAGKPWDPQRSLLNWDGKRWTGMDVADYSQAAPGTNVGPFIMNPEGVARLFSLDKLNDGPFPEHYEPVESPIGTNPLHPKVVSSPVARIFHDDLANMGKADEFPYVATTYSITELFRHWTKHAQLNAIVQPEQFVEIGEALAKEKGIVAGDTVKVMSKRGFIKAKAVVTKRIQALTIDGRTVNTIGIPCHWGFEGATRKGFLANTLTPSVGDANSQTPEYKAFLVNVEKA